MANKTRPIEVAIMAFPASTASVIYGLYDLFRSAGRDYEHVTGRPPRPHLIRPRVVAASGLQVYNGVHLTPDARLEEVGVPDVLCIPEVIAHPEERVEDHFGAECAWVKHCYERGSIIATVCTGTYLLAACGILHGEEATTHWAFCDAMQERYPDLRVRPDSALVLAGVGLRLVMAGGGTSWLDLGLYLIARTTDIDTAMNVARVNLVQWHGEGQQPFTIVSATRASTDAVVKRCQDWAAEHFHEPAPVAAMVALSRLPERTFTRRFKAATGMRPIEYVHALRLEHAKHLLETTTEPVEGIAVDVGYEDAAFFTRLFRRKVLLTPGQYRRRFGGMRDALTQRLG